MTDSTAPGLAAEQLLGAYAGATGPEAQRVAYDNFLASPGQQWLRDQGERSVLRNSAAIGGLGGGNVRKELTQYGQNLIS